MSPITVLTGADSAQPEQFAVKSSLGVPPESDANTVRTAYRKMSAKYHPDKYAQASANEQAEANRRMTEINAAYDALKAKKP